jgi:hypothetical protein
METIHKSLVRNAVTVKPLAEGISEPNSSCLSASNERTPTLVYFTLTVLGFSFWYFLAVPFASHRESYWWLAMVSTQSFSKAFSFISVTYRPLAQAVTWAAFQFLNPSVFPTSVLRQTLLQGFVYAMFVLAWWLVYDAAVQRRYLALVAFIAGGVFFSGYDHLFHLYGLMYVPVMLTLGALLRAHAKGTFAKRETAFAAVATLLAFWHPDVTALFLGFYFGFYLETFRKRSRAQHVQGVVILLAGAMVIAALLVALPLFGRAVPALLLHPVRMPLHSRLFGFLVSYQTNEISWIASLVAFFLAQMVVLSMGLSQRSTIAAMLLTSALTVVFLLKGLPILLIWLCSVLVKLLRLHSWSLFFLTLAAALLPLGSGIGTPVYALFATILAVYVTPLRYSQAEKALSVFTTPYALGIIVAASVVLLLVRTGIEVPIITRVARPLLVERERTYQLEKILAWLHNSEYCGYEVSFLEDAGNPIDSVESAILRRHRPPAGLEDVQLFWNTVLRCRKSELPNRQTETALVTFAGPALATSGPVFEVAGKYAGEAAVWIVDSRK